MNRPYDIKAFISLVERATTRVPDLTWGTDVMVGFPGESDNALSIRLMCAVSCPSPISTCSPTQDGRALRRQKWHGSCQRRSIQGEELADLSRDKRFAFAERWIGSSVAVLFRSGTIEGLRVGTTRHFLRVAVSCKGQLANQIHPVIITGASDRWAVGHILDWKGPDNES